MSTKSYTVTLRNTAGDPVSQKPMPVIRASDPASAAAIAAGRVFGSVVHRCTATVTGFDHYEAPRTFELVTR